MSQTHLTASPELQKVQHLVLDLSTSHPPGLVLLQRRVTLISHARKLKYHIGNKFKLRTLVLPNPNIQKS